VIVQGRVSLPIFQKRRPAETPVQPGEFALFRLGEQCNDRCPMCPNSGRPEAFFIETDELLRRIDFLSARGVHGVFVTGGEPTIHPGFWTVIDRLKERGFDWRVNTHGRTFADAEFTARAARADLKLAIVSFHSHDVAVSSAMFGVGEKAHWETVAGIERLLESRVPVMLNCVASALNAPHLGDFVRWCAARFGADYTLKFSFPLGFGKGAAWEHTQIRYRDLAGPLVALREAAAAAGIPVVYDSFPNCIVGDQDSINRGRSGCGETQYLEDVSGDRLISIPHIEANLTVYGKVCLECRAFQRCPGVLKLYASRYGVEELVPF
jgi:MoaA/NifB/PqqE/SkfB family radical SAM enzyme